MIVACFGGGTDSTAILCGWAERNYQVVDPIDVILFADTGGEKPHTYEHIARMNEWLPQHGFPTITVVQRTNKAQQPITLEGYCLTKKQLPSIVYGRKTCSQKHKIQPQDKYLNNLPAAKAWWDRRRGPDRKMHCRRKVLKLVGFEFTERDRWAKAPLEDDKYLYEFPLVEWEWSRADCVAAIERHGLPLPGKSACFFCPNSKKHEIRDLEQRYPVLFQRAVAMEDAARPNLVKREGLGRSFSWKDHMRTEHEAEDLACTLACRDG